MDHQEMYAEIARRLETQGLYVQLPPVLLNSAAESAADHSLIYVDTDVKILEGRPGRLGGRLVVITDKSCAICSIEAWPENPSSVADEDFPLTCTVVVRPLRDLRAASAHKQWRSPAQPPVLAAVQMTFTDGCLVSMPSEGRARDQIATRLEPLWGLAQRWAAGGGPQPAAPH